jgi:hypothetical protein
MKENAICTRQIKIETKEEERIRISGDGSLGYDNPLHKIEPGGFIKLDTDGKYEVTAKKVRRPIK